MDQYHLAKYFDDASHQIKEQKNNLKKEMPSSDLANIYGLYKQATIGDNNTERPGMFSFEGKAKWDAWTKYKGYSKERAQHEYVQLCMQYLPDSVTSKYV